MAHVCTEKAVLTAAPEQVFGLANSSGWKLFANIHSNRKLIEISLTLITNNYSLCHKDMGAKDLIPIQLKRFMTRKPFRGSLNKISLQTAKKFQLSNINNHLEMIFK